MTGSVFSCFVVGSGAVALRCAERLRLAGHKILGVYSFDCALKEMASSHEIPHANTLEQFEESLNSQPYEYLFSINNPWIIPSNILALASKNTINFHDSPLPKYAGLHATSWALINGESEHATCWHEVEEGIDRGRILKKTSFEITEDDTAFTLNMRVLELTVNSFQTLIDELATDTVSAEEQNTVGGSYYALSDRPDSACIISLRDSTQHLSNLVRALDFGVSPNPLGLPKLLVNEYGEILVFTSLAVVSNVASSTAGTVIEMSPGGLRIATVTGIF